MNIKKYLLFFLFSLLLCSCFKSNKNLHAEIEMIEPEIYAKYVSLVPGKEKPDLYYSDEAMQGLKRSRFTNQKWETAYLDQLDTQEHINPVMGKHFVQQNTLYYLDYQSESRIILKQLQEEGNDSILADATRISCSDFYLLRSSPEENPLLFYRDGGELKAGILEQQRYLEELEFDTSKFRDIGEFQVFNTLEYYTMVYSGGGSLFLVRLSLKKEEKRIDVESLLQIDSGIELFHAVLFDDDVTILYYSREYLLSYYRGGSNGKIGYYPEISFLNVNYFKDSPIFTICTPEKEIKNQPVYAVYLIHCNSLQRKNWQENVLVRSDIPFIAGNTLETQENFYLLLSGNFLQLLTIPKTGL